MKGKGNTGNNSTEKHQTTNKNLYTFKVAALYQ